MDLPSWLSSPGRKPSHKVALEVYRDQLEALETELCVAFYVVRINQLIEDLLQPPQEEGHPSFRRPFVHFRGLVLGFGYDIDKAGSHSDETAKVDLGQLLREAPHRFAGPSLRGSVHRNVEEDREERFAIPEIGVTP